MLQRITFVCTILITFSLLLVGCAEDVIPVGTVKITSNKTTYSSTDTITVSYAVTGGVAEYDVFWIEDDGPEIPATGLSHQFGPYDDAYHHTLKLKVVYSSNAILIDSVKVTSDILANMTPVERYGRLSVSGTQLVSDEGEPVQLRGMSTHGLQYFDDFYTANLFESLADDWGADIIRISCYVNEDYDVNGDYLSNPTYWREQVDTIVNYAVQNGLYAMIDWHMLSPGDPNYYLDEAKAFWTYMVDKHGHLDNVLFDICNEPNNDGLTTWKQVDGEWVQDEVVVAGKTVTWPIIKSYAEEILPIIRAQSENVIIVGTPNWASSPNQVKNNKLNDINTMYTMHFYAADHGESYRQNVRDAIAGGVPVFVTEFGTQEASGDGANDFVESQLWMDLMDEYKISWCNWNLSDDFRTGAVYNTSGSFGSVASYSSQANLKASGRWIFDKIKNRPNLF